MVKIILEKADIEKLIKDKYKCEEMSGLEDNIEVTIHIKEFIPPRPEQVIVPSGGAKSTVRKATIPGKAMGIERSRLPVY